MEQNIEKFRDGIYDYNKEIDFTRKPFNFYGHMTRINEDQKHKYAETRLVKYYISVIDQMVDKNRATEGALASLQEMYRRQEIYLLEA